MEKNIPKNTITRKRRVVYDDMRKKSLLEYCGARVGSSYQCPWRSDDTPSLAFYPSAKDKNIILFKDMAEKSAISCGSIIEFVQQLKNLPESKEGYHQAALIVQAWQGGQQIDLGKGMHKHEKYSDRDISLEQIQERKFERFEQERMVVGNANDSNYCRRQKIKMESWMQESLGAYMDGKNNLAWRNEVGDIHCKGGLKADKKSTYHDIVPADPNMEKGINTISVCGKRDSAEVVVLEGMGDAMAHVAMFRKTDPSQRCYISLNSTNNMKDAIKYISANTPENAKIAVWMDKGTAGDKATQLIQKAYPQAMNRTPVIDKYNDENGTHCKDVKDVYHAENSIVIEQPTKGVKEHEVDPRQQDLDLAIER